MMSPPRNDGEWGLLAWPWFQIDLGQVRLPERLAGFLANRLADGANLSLHLRFGRLTLDESVAVRWPSSGIQRLPRIYLFFF